MSTLPSKTNYGRKVPDFCGRLYTDDQPNGAAGTWVRRAEVDALLDEIAMLRRRLETRELNDLVQKHCSDETTVGRALHDEECANCGEGWSKHLTNRLICPDAAIPDGYRFAQAPPPKATGEQS